MTQELERGEAHLWLVRPDAAARPELLREYERLLTEDELRQKDRFHFPEGRHHYLLTRALVRTTLSRYTGVPPERWRFTTNEHGRPELLEPAVTPRLGFNLSHTHGLIACLVAADRDVGVDVEWTERGGRLVDIADRYFSPAEVEAMRALPEGARKARFYDVWTLKESFIKAVGVGISFGLSRFSFDLSSAEIGIAFDPGVPEKPACWQFTRHDPSPAHVVATCVRRRPGERVRVVVRDTVPLGG